MKKITTFLLVLVMCLGMCFSVFAETSSGPAGTYRFNLSFKDGTKLLSYGFSTPNCFIGQVSSGLLVILSDSPFFRSEKLGESPWDVSIYDHIYEGTNYYYTTISIHLPNYEYNSSSIMDCSSMTLADIASGLSSGSVSWNPPSDGSFVVQTAVYDSSIPAPKNLTFSTREEGGNIILAGTRYYTMKWTPPVDSTLVCRIDANVSGAPSAGGVSKVQYVKLADIGISPYVLADSGKYEFTASKIEEMIGGNLQRMDYIRLQYCKVKDDGIMRVGPISTITIKQGNPLNPNTWGGKYTYTVTTEFPKDESDVGSSGGLDDSYHDKWTPDGEDYFEYDQNGNLVDSGQNSTTVGDSINSIINSLLNIPTVITRLFSSLTSMMSGIGELPAFFAQVVTWLPVEIISLISLGIIIVIALRIFGR